MKLCLFCFILSSQLTSGNDPLINVTQWDKDIINLVRSLPKEYL